MVGNRVQDGMVGNRGRAHGPQIRTPLPQHSNGDSALDTLWGGAAV
jgi:hypothetical protein